MLSENSVKDKQKGGQKPPFPNAWATRSAKMARPPCDYPKGKENGPPPAPLTGKELYESLIKRSPRTLRKRLEHEDLEVQLASSPGGAGRSLRLLQRAGVYLPTWKRADDVVCAVATGGARKDVRRVAAALRPLAFPGIENNTRPGARRAAARAAAVAFAEYLTGNWRPGQYPECVIYVRLLSDLGSHGAEALSLLWKLVRDKGYPLCSVLAPFRDVPGPRPQARKVLAGAAEADPWDIYLIEQLLVPAWGQGTPSARLPPPGLPTSDLVNWFFYEPDLCGKELEAASLLPAAVQTSLARAIMASRFEIQGPLQDWARRRLV